MADRAREMLTGVPGVRLETPSGPLATLVTFTVGDLEPEAINLALEERGVLARWLPKPKCVRVSVGFWTDERDLESLADALATISAARS